MKEKLMIRINHLVENGPNQSNELLTILLDIKKSSYHPLF